MELGRYLPIFDVYVTWIIHQLCSFGYYLYRQLLLPATLSPKKKLLGSEMCSSKGFTVHAKIKIILLLIWLLSLDNPSNIFSICYFEVNLILPTPHLQSSSLLDWRNYRWTLTLQRQRSVYLYSLDNTIKSTCRAEIQTYTGEGGPIVELKIICTGVYSYGNKSVCS